jgi:FAD/FMN-containing dehydrogenase
MPYLELKQSFDDLGDLEGEVTSRSHFFRRPVPAAALPDAPGQELNFTPMGGAYNRIHPTATAFVHRTERFLVEHVGTDAAWVHRTWTDLHEHSSGRVYPNFPDLFLDDPLPAYHGENLQRLKEVKRHYDPHGLLRFPQSL